jgi:hypothetical protein
MNPTDTELPDFAYCTGWNDKLRKPILGEVWLTEDQARKRFEVEHTNFQVLDPVALHGEPPSFIILVRPDEDGWQKSERYNTAGSLVVSADLRATDGRYFVTRVWSWTYPDADKWYSMSGSTSITTVTFEPDGTGTFTLKDKLEPANSMRMEARDIPVDDNWVDRFEFGDWDVLKNLKALEPTTTVLPPR